MDAFVGGVGRYDPQLVFAKQLISYNNNKSGPPPRNFTLGRSVDHHITPS